MEKHNNETGSNESVVMMECDEQAVPVPAALQEPSCSQSKPDRKERRDVMVAIISDTYPGMNGVRRELYHPSQQQAAARSTANARNVSRKRQNREREPQNFKRQKKN